MISKNIYATDSIIQGADAFLEVGKETVLNTDNVKKYDLAGVIDPGLSNLAGTIATLLGYNDFPSSWGKSLIKMI